jgi:hypothetical protein
MRENRIYKGIIPIAVVMVVVISLGFVTSIYSQESKEGECFFYSSLHATAKGMDYWYGKAQGGIEAVSGIPYSELTCKNCHLSSCDVCHKEEVNGKLTYSVEVAKDQQKCLSCHAREAQMIMKIDKEANTPDVHFANGMKCMDCHTGREMHGDSIAYNSMKEIGAMDVKCERCHESVNQSISHTVHGTKLDCKACHVRHVVSCNNCHFETMIKEKKRVAQPVSDWKFLMNYNGKVTAANMQTFVLPENKTFLIFAPQFSHSIKKEGDKCEDCHGIDNVKKVRKNNIRLTWLEKGKVLQAHGIIPVVDGIQYHSVFQNYENGTWTPISNAMEPKVQYVGYGTPLTKEQLSELAKPEKSTK